jgi:hypothetical protein
MMRPANYLLALPVCACITLTGCGLSVPEIQEFPGKPSDGRELVREIVHSVHCEITRAIISVAGRKYADGHSDPGTANAKFLAGWGAETALTLTIDEKSTLSPNGIWMPTKIFNLTSGLSASSDATRIEKMNFFYDLDALRNADLDKTCPANPEHDAFGSFLVQSDLKIREWLSTEVVATDLGEIGGITDSANAFKQNVIQHEVTFDVITSANVAPSWKLVRATVNPNTLFSTSRDRKHDLLITFGPIDKTQKNPSLIPVAENLHFTAQFPSNTNVTSP